MSYLEEAGTPMPKQYNVRYQQFPEYILKFTKKFINREIIAEFSKLAGTTEEVFTNQLAFQVANFILPKYTIKAIKVESNRDFFGVLAGVDEDQKQAQILQTYKLIFRFSIEKLLKFLEDYTFLAILMKYLQETKMRNVHSRKVLNKNQGAYYRVVENMVNLSPKSEVILDTMNRLRDQNLPILDEDHIIYLRGKEAKNVYNELAGNAEVYISLENLREANKSVPE